jgi:gluconokinase
MSTAASPPAFEAVAIVVMGVSGCGKTSVGEAIARHFGTTFIEGDGLHPEANIAKMSAGIALTDEDRFPWLDRIGAEIAGATARGERIVISCSALRKTYRDRVRAFAGGRLTFIFLRGSEELLAGRMRARNGHFMPPSLLKSQLATLEDPTGEAGVLSVDIDGTTAEVIEIALEGLMKISG